MCNLFVNFIKIIFFNFIEISVDFSKTRQYHKITLGVRGVSPFFRHSTVAL